MLDKGKAKVSIPKSIEVRYFMLNILGKGFELSYVFIDFSFFLWFLSFLMMD